MKFDVVTIFPELVDQMTSTGVVGRGRDAGRLDIAVHDLRDFADGRHRAVDDAPYGGGPGMLLKAAPFMRAVAHVRAKRGEPQAVVLMSPQGTRLCHLMVERLSRLRHIVLLCGRYEGVDERVRTHVATEEISIGDYVVSGGEMPAAVLLDTVARQVPGVVGDSASVADDSFVRHMLDYPNYTRPAVLDGHAVPDVLVSGNHEEIRRWRKREAVRRTLVRRPDLLSSAHSDELDKEEQDMLLELATQGLKTGVEV